MRKGTWAAIVVLLLLQPIAAMILVLASGRQLSHLSFLAFVGSWMYVILRLAHQHWNRLYFLVESFRLRWTGRGISWQSQAEYSVAALDGDLVRRIADELRKSDARSTILAEEPNKVIFQVNGITLAVHGHPAVPLLPNSDPESSTLIVQVVEGIWPFAKAVELATDTAPGLFETARRLLSPTSEKYWAEIRFTSGNPYFGFFLRNINLASVDRFTVDLQVPVPGDSKPAAVTAKKDHMTIVTRRSSTLATVSRRYLAMAG
jgi:hypothetical protein